MKNNAILASEPVKTLTFQQCALPISNSLHRDLQDHITQHQPDIISSAFTINFRDKDYSAEAGGYHPVEISILKESDNQWSILYITDFAYVGLTYPELERDIDFDIGNGMAYLAGMGWKDISSPEITELFKLWEKNFLTYLGSGAYDDIEVTTG